MTFEYNSQQLHSIRENNKNLTKLNSVKISNNAGKKITKIIQNGKTIKNMVTPLKFSEIAKIKNNIFIPKLFQDHKFDMTTVLNMAKRSKRSRTRKQRK